MKELDKDLQCNLSADFFNRKMGFMTRIIKIKNMSKI